MDIEAIIEMNGQPQRFVVHAQSKVTSSTSDRIDTFAHEHSLKRSTAIRILIDLGLAAAEESGGNHPATSN